MKNPKRILVAHTDAHTRRMLTMLLVEAGLSVHAVEPEVTALTPLSEEAFDLALLGQLTLDDKLFQLALPLRESQPDLPIVMLLPELQLPLVVQGIRHGLTDVLPLRTDPKPVIRRIMALVGLVPDMEPTSAELAEVEATLAQLDPALEVPAIDQEIVEQRDRLWKGLREIHLERELITAAQAGMDEKARLLTEERSALRCQKEKLAVEATDLRAEGAELNEAWRTLDQQQNAIRLERENLTKIERDLRQRQMATETHARPPFPLPSRVPGPADKFEHEWDALEREKVALEAERALFRDERMLITDLDRKRRGLPPPPPKAFVKTRPVVAPVSKPSLFRKFMGNRA